MMKRALSVLLACCLLTSLFPATVFASTTVDGGSCGEDATWALDIEGTLTIKGTGEISSLWLDNSEDVETVVIESGITSVGSYSFNGYENLSSIYLADTVTSIGTEAFGWCRNLKSIEMGTGLIQIGARAFESCESLVNVVIPDSVTAISKSAFSSCCALANVDFGNGVKTIGAEAFRFCWNLSNINLPDSLTSIGDYAFGSNRITRITIPQNTVNIGKAIFYDCEQLEEIEVSPSNPYYSSENGVLFNKDKTTIICCPCGMSGEYRIPGTVNSIADYAFNVCWQLSSIVIPNSVTTLGEGAFSACHNLTGITIPSSVTDIGDYAFGFCQNLLNINVANGNLYFSTKNGVLFNKSQEELICYPCGLSGSYAIPEGVTCIGDSSFADCMNLTSVIIPNSVQLIGDAAFKASGLTSINIPNSVTSIGESAFENCALRSINIPSSISAIKNETFLLCNDLADVKLSRGITYIGKSAFAECPNLTHVSIPSGVIEIDEGAFGYSGLLSINLPSSISDIRWLAFDGCDSLSNVYYCGSEAQWSSISIEQGNDVLFDADIHYDIDDPSEEQQAAIVASGYCGGEGDGTNITWMIDSAGTLTISGAGRMRSYSSEYIHAPWRYDHQYSIKKVVIENGITNIGDSAFAGAFNLTSAIIPESVLSIGGGAFYHCSSLTEIAIPEGVTSIGNWAFCYCNLTNLEIPNGVTSIGGSAFFGCSSLANIEIPNSVTSIGTYAFSRCSSLTSVTIPDSITVIAADTFYGCSGLTSVEIPSSVMSIEFQAFCGCSGLTNITIPSSVTSIGEDAFASCSNLTQIVIPSSVTFIGSNAFSFCTRLTRIELPASVEMLGAAIFSGCSQLKSINVDNKNKYFASINGVLYNKEHTSILLYPCGRAGTYILPEGVTTIGNAAFNLCDKLTGIIVPKTTTDIVYGAFLGCSNLTSIELPDSIVSIDINAFNGCDKLSHVFYGGDVATWNTISIKRGNNRLTSATIIYNYRMEDSQSNISISATGYNTTPTSRLFRVSAMGASYPSPAGFIVDVDGQKYSSGQTTCTGTDDITAIVPSGYNGNITISRDGYHIYTIPASMTGQYNVVTMVPSSVTEPFAQMLMLDKTQGSYVSCRNLLLENEVMYENDIFSSGSGQIIRLYPSVDWNGHGVGSVWLEQGDIRANLTNNVMNEIDWSQYYFEANRTVYLCAIARDGTTIRTATGLKVYKKLSGIGLNFGDTIEIDTRESATGDISILSDSGEKISIDLKSLSDGLVPISASVKADGTIEGVIGLTLAQGKDTASVFGAMKNSIDRLATETTAEQSKKITSLLKEMKQNGTPIEQASSFGVKGSVQVLGYFTGNLLDGKAHLTESKVALVFSGSLGYTYNTVVAGVPAYIKSSLSAKIEAYLKMKYDELLQEMTPDGKQSLKASLSLSAEAGPGWEGYFSGGVKGKGSLKLSTQIPMSKEETAFSLQASFSFVGTVCGVEGEWQFYETPEKIFWDGSEPGYWCWKDKDSATAQALYFYPNLHASLMSMYGTGNAIADGVSGYAAPALMALSGGRLLAVWTADVEGRSAIDKGGVYYSIYKNDAWSTAALIDNDGTNDSLPRLYEQNGTIYAAWQNYTTTFNTDTLPDYDIVAAQLSYVAASFDANSDTWSAPAAITETEFGNIAEVELPADYDDEWPVAMSARQVLDNGFMRAVLYTALDDDEAEQVFGLFNDGYGWGEPVRLTNESSGLNGFSAVLNSDSISILYTTGDYANSTLKLCEASLGADLAVTDVDYVRQTLVPNNELTISTTVKNDGPVTVNGVHVSVANAGNVVHEEDIAVRFYSGEEDILYVNYQLPEIIDFNSLTVTAVPMMDDDADESDNSAVCPLYMTDLSVENVSATYANGATEVLTQIVNRGQTETTTATLTFHKGTPDGEVVGVEVVPVIRLGDVENIVVSLDHLSARDMVYVDVSQIANENLIGNNSSQAVVLEGMVAALGLSANASRNSGNLIINIDISNSTSATMENLNLIAAAYDADGKQLGVKSITNVSVAALNSVEKSAMIAVGSINQSVTWKVFLLDEDWCPLVQPANGIIAQ